MAVDWGWAHKRKMASAVVCRRKNASEAQFARDLVGAESELPGGNLEWHRFRDMQRKWVFKSAEEGCSRPEKDDEGYPYIGKIVDALDLRTALAREKASAEEAFMNLDALVLFERLKAEFQTIVRECDAAPPLRESVPAETKPRRTRSIWDTWHTHYLDPELRSLDRKEFDNVKIVDQRICYLTPHAVRLWLDLIKVDAYQNFANCASSLRHFLVGDLWQDFVRLKLKRIIMLGAGAADKSQAIIKSLLVADIEPSRLPIDFVLVDVSPYMIESEVVELSTGRNRGIVKLISAGFDFLQSRKLQEAAHSSQDGSAAFFILGCTFGNIDERDFLIAMAQAAHIGDLLIVGNEFIDEDNVAVYEEELRRRYDTAEFRDMALEPVARQLDSMGLPHDEAFRRSLVKVDTITAEPEKHGPLQFTQIGETIAVVARFDLSAVIDAYPDLRWYDKVILIMSKRYKLARFIDFVEAAGFKQRITENASYKPYKQVVFEKVTNVNS